MATTMFTDALCVVVNPDPASNYYFVGTLRLNDNSTVDQIRTQAALCCQWPEASLTINLYAYEGVDGLGGYKEYINQQFLKDDFHLVSSERPTAEGYLVVVVTITSEYIMFMHTSVDEPLEFIVHGTVEGPPSTMVGSVAEIAHSYPITTDDGPVRVDVYVYETTKGSDIFDESLLKGTAWKRSMNLLSFPGGHDQVPRGKGCLFVELLTRSDIDEDEDEDEDEADD